MAKAILIMNEMPECCGDCRCSDIDTKEKCWICLACGGEEIHTSGKPEWCPLVEFPEKNPINPELKPGVHYREDVYEVYKNGWNACIDKIIS